MSNLVMYDQGAEESLLGSLMLKPALLPDINPRLTPECFYLDKHGKIYAAIQHIDRLGKKPDPILVADTLDSRGELGGDTRVFLHNLVHAVGAPSQAPHYADIILKHSMSRRLSQVASTVKEMQTKGKPEEVMLYISQALEELEGQAIGQDVTPLEDALRDQWQHLEALAEQGSKTAGHPTGFAHLDNIISGLRPGNLIILAARPGMGKTAFALSLLERVAQNNPEHAKALFCLEQSQSELTNRIISSATRIPHDRLQLGDLQEEEWKKILRVQQDLGGLSIYLDDQTDLNLSELRAKSRRLKRKHGNLDIIIVDYVQLLLPDRKLESREREVADISRRLKMLSKELHTPVVALAQLSREVEKRGDKHPILSDLRESGSLEQDADAVLFLYRDEYYNPDSNDRGTIEVVVAKNRHGKTGKFKLAFFANCGHFQQMPQGHPGNQKGAARAA